MPNVVEILVTAKDIAKATIEGASVQTDELAAAADRADLAMERAGLSARTAGDNAERAMTRASAAANKAAESQTAAAEASEKLAKGEIDAAEAGKAEAAALKDAATAADMQVRSVRAAERAQLALRTSAVRTGEAQEASAAAGSAASLKMAAGLEKLQKVGKTALLGIVAGAIGVGVESSKMSMKFDAAITLLNTQAGVAKSKLGGLSDGVLKLAGQVGQNPDSLAEALFHVESNMASMGISSVKALNMVKIAAEGASTGKANLVDVTNALTAAVASGIPGTQNMSQAMGILNATVGAGDMKMQDLADAFGGGMIAVVKGFGLNIRDVGAALAVFGDNNIRGAKAGTMLRMSVQALAAPVAGGAAALKKLGLSTDSLAKDMQHGGLNAAIKDLVERMDKAGISAKQQGQIITDAFGKKAGAGIDVLVGQFKRLESKYPDLSKGASNFANDWATTQKTFSQKVDDIKGAIDSLMIHIGEKLLPVLSKMMDYLSKHTGTLKIFAGVIGGVLLVAIAAYAVAMTEAAIATIAATWPILAVVAAVALLVAGIIYAWGHFTWFRDGVKALGKSLEVTWNAVWKACAAVVKWFVNGPLKDIKEAIAVFSEWWKSHGAEVKEVASAVWKFVSAVIKTEWGVIWNGVLKPGLSILESAWKLSWGIVRDTTKMVINVIKVVVSTGVHSILDIIGIILDLITGHWKKAWSDLKNLASTQLHGAINLIKAIASGFGTLLYDAGKNLIKGLIRGIESMASSAVGSVESIVSGISSLLPHSPAKTGPLSGSGSPEIAGRKIGSMLAEGLTSGAGPVSRASQSLVRAVGLPTGLGFATSRPVIQQQPAAASEAPMYVTIMIGEKNIGEIIIDPLRRSIRKRGGNVQAVLGAR